jgi:lysophospholipase L1-like esterase
MLGTNDLKARYNLTPYDIAESIGTLIEITLKSGCGRDDGPPHLLLLAPPPLGKLDEYAETFSGGIEKSKKLSRYYRSIADRYECSFFDASSVIQSSRVDGLHIDPEDHQILGKRLAQIVIDILNSKNN